MNEIKIKGEVLFVDEVKVYGAKGFRKHEVVIKTGNEKYPNPIQVEFIKTAIDASTALQVGQEVEIECRLNGRDWTNPKDGVVKYFTSVEGMEINYCQGEVVQEAVQEEGEEEDVPF
jgi:hypothetical protein